MTRILDRAKAHFGQRRSISVPEWPDEDGNPAVLFWQPFTLEEQSRLRAMRDAASDDAIDGSLRILIAKAQDESGNRLFDIGDRPVLRTAVDALVIDRILAAMMDVDGMEHAVKN
jgi:hypothetical protein